MSDLATITIEVPGAPPIRGLTFRAFRGESDLPALVELMRATEIADGTFEIIGVATLANQLANLNDFEPERDQLLAEIDDRLVACSQRLRTIRDGTRIFDTTCWVHPDVRRRGLGRAILAHAEERLRERAAAEAEAGETRPAALGAWSRDTIEGQTALLAQAGYVQVRWFFDMLRPTLDDLPPLELPDGLEIRPTTPDRAHDVVLADFEAFLDHWGTRQMTEVDARRILGDPETDISLWQVAWDGDLVAGSVLPAIYPDDNAMMGIRRGWLDRVAVRRPWRRRGVARALIVSALVELRRRGMSEAMLGVDAENPTGALGLYEGLGFRVHRRSAVYRKPI